MLIPALVAENARLRKSMEGILGFAEWEDENGKQRSATVARMARRALAKEGK